MPFDFPEWDLAGSAPAPGPAAPTAGAYWAPSYWAASYWPGSYWGHAARTLARRDRDVYADIAARARAAVPAARVAIVAPNEPRTATRGPAIEVLEAGPGAIRDAPDGLTGRERHEVRYGLALTVEDSDPARANATLGRMSQLLRADGVLSNAALAGFTIPRETRLVESGHNPADTPLRRLDLVGTFAYVRDLTNLDTTS